MTVLLLLVPAALFLGLLGLIAFLWSLKTGQFEDPKGAAMRILIEDDDDEPSGGAAGRNELLVGMPSGVADERKHDD
jgi:cbb3-type cytochrome oxidase maturation protein